jgi:hypothetical protein
MANEEKVKGEGVDLDDDVLEDVSGGAAESGNNNNNQSPE